jgi:hypothetical protein
LKPAVVCGERRSLDELGGGVGKVLVGFGEDLIPGSIGEALVFFIALERAIPPLLLIGLRMRSDGPT